MVIKGSSDTKVVVMDGDHYDYLAGITKSCGAMD